MSRPAESMTIDGVTHSWYCTVCGAELGADLDEYDGMPPAGCAIHGTGHLAWETWNVETDPAYPHLIIRSDEPPPHTGLIYDEDPEEWCPEHEDWYDGCPCYGGIPNDLPAGYTGGPLIDAATLDQNGNPT